MSPAIAPPRLEHYRLLAQIGTHPDGVCYRANPPGEDVLVEVRTLEQARTDAARWTTLTRHLGRARLLEHPGAVRLRHLGLDAEPSFLVLEWIRGPTLKEALQDRLPLSLKDALSRATDLCPALAAAHRLGLVHGRLQPDTIRLTDLGRPRLDFTIPPGEPADPAEDVAALARLLLWMHPQAESASSPLADLVRDMIGPPGARPTIREADNRLGELLGGEQDEEPASLLLPPVALPGRTLPLPDRWSPLDEGEVTAGSKTQDVSTRGRLGRFLLLEKLGRGGMGDVFRAQDDSDGQVVAIKVLRPEWVSRPDALRRFHKEARLLAEVNNPYVTNLIEVNEDEGIHYLVLEYVPGQCLGRLLAPGKPLEEGYALAVLADVCRGLAEAHRRGIVHRDVKPDNILLVRQPGEEPPANTPFDATLVKLSDFGLARHIIESDSLQLTRPGAIVGTPLYLSPEQCGGKGSVGPRADVYGLGATLFHLLAGRPPFLGEETMAVIAKHCNDPPPDLGKLNPAVSEGACRVVERALAKKPEQRHADAGELLRDLLRLLRGEPVGAGVHPRLPECDPDKVLKYDFHWDLAAPPERLWPLVSNTERLNRAINLPAVRYKAEVDEEGKVHRRAGVRRFGMDNAWEEHPFEWVEGQRFGVLREFTQGPCKWLLSVVQLEPRGSGGARLTHSFRLEPRGLLGRTLAAVELGVKTRRALDRVYRRIATLAVKGSDNPLADPFEEPASLSNAQRRRLDEGLDRMTVRGTDPAIAERLGDFLALASPQEVARIRPLALARRLGLAADPVIAACLHGAREGLLVLSWDLLCPVCRIPSETKDTLAQLREHGRCEACNIEFGLDFASGVELIFRAHPGLREVELGTFCIGGPAHSPHVAAQVRIAAGECLELDLALAEGAYRLRGPQLAGRLDFRVRQEGTAQRWDIDLGRLGGTSAASWLLRSGRQVLALANTTDQELLVRVERQAVRDDALTAARASAMALFRELFPQEVLSPGQLVSVAALTFLVTDLAGAAELYERREESRVFALLHEHLLQVERCGIL